MTQVETQWDPALYNDKHGFVYDYGESLIELLHPEKHERILDLGCGSGQLTFKISELAREVVGIDMSGEMIASARAKYKDLNFQVADGSDFSFEEKFDAIFSNAALHWIIDYQGAIQSMFNSLKKNGRMVVEFGGKGNVQTIVNQLRASLAKRDYVQQAQLQLWYFPSIGEYTSALEAAGFRVMMAQHFDRPTKLADEKTGIKDWITMFGASFFQGVSPDHIEEIKTEVQEKVRTQCFYDGAWFADYKRIRVVATKE